MGKIRKESRKVVRVVCFCVLVGCLSALPASAQVIFSMDYSAGSYPSGGWQNTWPESSEWRRVQVPGVGPNGQNTIEMIQLYDPSGGSFGGQHYWGWWGFVEGSDPSRGARRYYRWRMYFTPDSNMRSRSWADGSPTGAANKLLIVGDTCGTSCRFILTYEADVSNNRIGYFRIQLDGGANLADTQPYSLGTWLNIQVELTSSTTSSSGNGSYKIWINNNNYNSPSAQRSGFQLNPTNWRMVGFGYFSNHGLASNGVHKWRHTDFQVATSFDANWSSGGTTTTPTPQSPSNVRIMR